MSSFYMPGLSHFQNDNGWSGSQGVMCYEIDPPKEGQLHAAVWYGPFWRTYAEETAQSDFPLTDDGLAALTQWLLAQAEQMNQSPQKSLQQCRDDYLARTQPAADA